jgi:hypothetical protein
VISPFQWHGGAKRDLKGNLSLPKVTERSGGLIKQYYFMYFT